MRCSAVWERHKRAELSPNFPQFCIWVTEKKGRNIKPYGSNNQPNESDRTANLDGRSIVRRGNESTGSWKVWRDIYWTDQ